MTQTTTTAGSTDDDHHAIFAYFAAAGWDRDDFVDPGHVSPEDIHSGGWRVARWNASTGVLTFPIDGDDVVAAATGVGVSFVDYLTTDIRQPIDFADEYDPLVDSLDPMSQLIGRSDTVTLFVKPDADASLDVDTKAEAVQALDKHGHRGEVLRPVADAMAALFGLDLGDGVFNDSYGMEVIRPDLLATGLAGQTDTGSRSPDSGISGHKQRARQKFYRNVDALKEAVGLDDAD